MSACAMQTFNNLTRAAWTCVQAAAAQYGVAGSDSGQASSNGFSISWSYDENTGTLHIQCTDSPWFVSCSTINSHVHDTVQQCLDQHQIEMTHIVPS